MAKTTKRKTAPRARDTAANNSAIWARLELKKKLRREREIVKLANQLDRARLRSTEALRQFAIDYLEELGLEVQLKAPSAPANVE